MNPETNADLLFEILLMLKNGAIIYEPAVDLQDSENSEGFYALYEEIMLDIMRQATFVSRINPEMEPNRDSYTV